MFYSVLRFPATIAIHSIGIVPLCYLTNYEVHKEAIHPLEDATILLFITLIGSLCCDGILYVFRCGDRIRCVVKCSYHAFVVGYFVCWAVQAYDDFRPAWEVVRRIRRVLDAESAGVRITNSPFEITIRVDDPDFDDADLLEIAQCANESNLYFQLHVVNSAVTYAGVSCFGNGRTEVEIYLDGPRFGKEGLPDLSKNRGNCEICFVDGSLQQSDFRAPLWSDPTLKIYFLERDDVPEPRY